MTEEQIRSYSEFIVGNNLTRLVLDNKDITQIELKRTMNETIPIIEQAYKEIKDTHAPKQIFEKLTIKAKIITKEKLKDIINARKKTKED